MMGPTLSLTRRHSACRTHLEHPSGRVSGSLWESWKEEKEKSQKKTNEAVYEVSLSYSTEEHKENDEKDPNDINLECLNEEDKIILKEHSSRKPSFKNQYETFMPEPDNNAEVKSDNEQTYLHDVAVKRDDKKIKRNTKSGKLNRNSLLSEITNEVSVESGKPWREW